MVQKNPPPKKKKMLELYEFYYPQCQQIENNICICRYFSGGKTFD